MTTTKTKIKNSKGYTRLNDWRAHKLGTLRIGGHDAINGLHSVGVVGRDVFISVRDGVRKAWEKTAEVTEKQKEAIKEVVHHHDDNKKDTTGD